MLLKEEEEYDEQQNENYFKFEKIFLMNENFSILLIMSYYLKLDKYLNNFIPII